MAFEGDLRELEMGDVLQTLAMTRQFGTLVVRGSEERRVGFTEKGLALLSYQPSHGERVARLLVGTGRLDPAALEEARHVARRRRGSNVDEVVLEAGAATADDVRSARRYIAQEDIFDLFRWREGRFVFQAEEITAEGPFAQLWFDISGIAMEAARRLDELPALDIRAPLGEVFLPNGEDSAPVPGTAAADLVRVYALLDGTRTVEDVVAAYHLGAFDTRKSIAALVDAGTVRRANAEEILLGAESVSDPVRAARLLQRAVERAPSEIAAWRRLADALAASGERRQAADALAELARLRHVDGDGEGALETLRSALKLDRTNPIVHTHLTRLQFALGRVEDALAAARDAAAQCLAADAPESALGLAREGLTYRPDDVPLRRASAAALAALGRPQEALAILDELAAHLEASGEDEDRLVDVYRAILSLAPDRTECERLIEELVAADARRRRRRIHAATIAAGVLVLALAAIPFMGGPSVQDRVDQATIFVDRGLYPDAKEILTSLEGESMTEDEEIAIRNLGSRMESGSQPSEALPLRREFSARLEKRYTGASGAVQDGRLSDGLGVLELAVAEFATPEAKELERVAPDAMSEFRAGLANETQGVLTTVESRCIDISKQMSSAAERFRDSKVLQRAALTPDVQDLQDLRDLAALADATKSAYGSNDWEVVANATEHLVDAARPAKPSVREGILEAVEALIASWAIVEKEGESARAYVHRAQLLSDFRDTKMKAADLAREGRLEDAADHCQRYLEFCSGIRDGNHGGEYERIVLQYLDDYPFEDILRTQLDTVRDILDRERRAEEALDADDVETAFQLRAELVRAHPSISFSSRFELPLRVSSRPPGAEIYIVDGPSERVAGTTPQVIQYPASGPSTIAIRHAGFEEYVAERKGAVEDTTAAIAVDLTKHALWISEHSASTEAGPAFWQRQLFIADREGVVRALSLDDGHEIARKDTHLLGGFSGAPAVHGDRVHVAGVDGIGYVFDARTLDVVRRYEIGARVQVGLLATGPGVVVADDHGEIHMIDDTGEAVWVRSLGPRVLDPALSPHGIVVVTVDGELLLLSTSSGEIVRRVSLPGKPRWSSPVVSGGRAYVASEDGTLCGVELASGEVAWERHMDEPLTGRPAVSDGLVAVATMRGQLALFAPPTTPTPVLVAEEGPLEDGLVGCGAACVVAAGRTGIVRGLDAAGNLVWRFDARDSVTAHPTMLGGVLYLVTHAGRVIAIEP